MADIECPNKCGKTFKAKSGHYYDHVKKCPGVKPITEEYSWCEKCQKSYQGETCPGCVEEVKVQPDNPTTLEEVAQEVEANKEITTITEILPVPLTDLDYKDFGIKLGLANQEISLAEDELNSVKQQYKSRIVSAEGRRNEYSSIINAGHQQKQVECHLVKDFTENTITKIRLDTGETVGEPRTMTAAERQRGLGFSDPEGEEEE